MRAAGCVINDLWDKDFDKHVHRTRSRPLASGQLSQTQALAFLALQLTAGMGVLVSFNTYSIVLGLCSMPIVVAYPLMKRYTFWPQAVLGLAFNWGALIGWAAVHGECSWVHVLPLYCSGVAWTLVYDTLYAYQDRRDDQKLGLRSTALLFGEKPQIVLTAFAAIMVGGLATSGYAAELSAPFYAGLGLTSAHLLWQIWTADLHSEGNLWRRFSSNASLGAIVMCSIVAGHF
jgi:4-hydroxybenzoate polyprenyltransferase